MRTRCDICLEITPSSLRGFDNGAELKQKVPVNWLLKVDDQVNWKCAHFEGTARIVALSEPLGDGSNEIDCVFKKVS